jgi:uncharacterized protein (DUF1015 family)
MKEFQTKVNAFYVADGHHRAASAYRVGVLRRQQAKQQGKVITGEEGFNFFLAVLFPHHQLQILEYNRVVRDLNGLSPSEYLQRLQEAFDIVKVSSREEAKPKKTHQFGMLLNTEKNGLEWYQLTVKSSVLNRIKEDPVQKLDVCILENNVLASILNIS